MVKKALIVGINYIGQQGELRGCINDSKNMEQMLYDHYDYTPENTILLIEEEGFGKPTKDNILAGLRWLPMYAEDGDVLTFHYSGHGSQIKDTDGDESDGRDETLVPLDYTDNGMITDDELFTCFIDRVPKGVTVRIVLDCCHSGSGMDLRYNFTQMPKDAKKPRFESLKAYLEYVQKWYVQYYKLVYSDDKYEKYRTELPKGYRPLGYVKTETIEAESRLGHKYKYCFKTNYKYDKAKCDVVMISGCADSETSSDAYIRDDDGAEFTGALTYYLRQTLKDNDYDISLMNLVLDTREELKENGYAQVPQLSSGRKVRVDEPFSF